MGCSASTQQVAPQRNREDDQPTRSDVLTDPQEEGETILVEDLCASPKRVDNNPSPSFEPKPPAAGSKPAVASPLPPLSKLPPPPAQRFVLTVKQVVADNRTKRRSTLRQGSTMLHRSDSTGPKGEMPPPGGSTPHAAAAAATRTSRPSSNVSSRGSQARKSYSGSTNSGMRLLDL